MLNKLFFLTLLLVLSISCFATKFETIANGYWNQNSIWLNGTIPPSTCSDTIYVHHDVALTNNITLQNGGFLKIDSLGGICGHVTITAESNSAIISYGFFQIDVMNVPGGGVDFYPPGNVILTQYGVISNGGHLSSHGNSLVVGPWFECAKGVFSIDENSNYIDFKIFPNPAEDNLVLDFETSDETTYIITDISGKIISKGLFTKSINISFLKSGIYFITIKEHALYFNSNFIKL